VIRLPGLVGLGLTAAAWLTPATAPAQTLSEAADACLATISQAPPGDDDSDWLIRRCPLAASLLAGSDWGEALGDYEAASLDPEQFAALVAFVARYEARATASGDLDTAALGQIVAELEPFVPPPELTLWEQVLRWFRERFGGDEGESGWLAGWLESISLPAWSLELVLWALGAVVVVGALAVVINELRQGGLFAGQERRGRRAGAAAGAARSPRPRSLDDIRAAPTAAQPGLMLVFVLDRLRTAAAQAFPASATHRELAVAAAAANAEWREPLATISTAAERATFGRWRPAADELGPVWAAGERLLASLEQAPSEPA
jgi:hypothetical protein